MSFAAKYLAYIALVISGLLQFSGSAALAAPVAVVIFMGQSNMNALGTQKMTVLPGSPAFNAACTGYITPTSPAGASANAETLTCLSNIQGTVMPGQVIGYPGSNGTSIVSSSNVSGTMPSVTGTGGIGTYVVSAGSSSVAIGSAAAPVALTFTMPDIGGSGTFNARCMMWTPTPSNTGGQWQVNQPFANGVPIDRAHMFGPESSFCQHWTAANPGQTLYMIKASQGGSFLCDMPASNDVSPESLSDKTRVYSFAYQETAQAEAALTARFGASGYHLVGIIYVQGEQDNQHPLCGFPLAPFNSVGYPASVSGSNVYLANLVDLIGRLAISKPVNASFTGSISGGVLTVSALSSGSIHQYQLVAGTGILPDSVIGLQIDGTPGGVGHYHLQVNQAGGAKGMISSSSGATTACGYVSGGYFLADGKGKSSNAIIVSCVTGGQFHVGDTLTGNGLAPNTVITALDSAGHTTDGIYTINAIQAINPEPMTATLVGWGNGANTARFITNRTVGSQTNGVGLAQQIISDSPGTTALPAATVYTDDRTIYEPNPLHYDGSWYSEFGRRLYQAFIGQCTYHTPTC